MSKKTKGENPIFGAKATKPENKSKRINNHEAVYQEQIL